MSIPTGVVSGRAVVLRCGSCGEPLTSALELLSELPEPVGLDDGIGFAPTLRPGFVAVDPEPFGRWADGNPAGSVGCFVIHPEEGLGLVRHPDARRNSGCCGHDGLDGPNRLCPGCGAEVATLRDDCWTRVELRVEPGAVRLAAVDG